MNLKEITNQLQNLSTVDQQLIRKFEADPNGPLFVTVSDLLRKRGYLDESIVLLEQGLKTYPNFHSARAALGRDYYFKGMLVESLNCIDTAIRYNPDNLMAQRIRLKIAILLGDTVFASASLKILSTMTADDECTRIVRHFAKTEDWHSAKEYVLLELQKLGIKLDGAFAQQRSHQGVTTQTTEPVTEVAPWAATSLSQPLLPDLEKMFPTEDSNRQLNGLSVFDATGTLFSVRGPSVRYDKLNDFSPLELGQHIKDPGEPHANRGMDNKTIAEIFAGRKQYTKAIQVLEADAKSALDENKHKDRLVELRQLSAESLTQRVIPANENRAKIQKLEALLDRLENRQLRLHDISA